MNPTLTILTTTYNRAHILSQCYDSLCKQTCKDFEWLIIDDGSTDGTRQAIEKIKNNSFEFPISYHYKENGGKHTAINFSHPYIRGEYLLMLDDDDTLTGDAVETILRDWSFYSHEQRIGCISYQKRDTSTGKTLVDWNSTAPVISNTIDFRINAHRGGDCAEVIRTKMLVEYPAPIFENEKFLTEDFLWLNSAFAYDTVYIGKVIYLCEYRNDGLTKNKNRNRLKNPHGGMYTCNLYFNSRISVFVQMKKAVLFDCYALATGSCLKCIKQARSPIKCIATLPVAWVIYKRWTR